MTANSSHFIPAGWMNRDRPGDAHPYGAPGYSGKQMLAQGRTAFITELATHTSTLPPTIVSKLERGNAFVTGASQRNSQGAFVKMEFASSVVSFLSRIPAEYMLAMAPIIEKAGIVGLTTTKAFAESDRPREQRRWGTPNPSGGVSLTSNDTFMFASEIAPAGATAIRVAAAGNQRRHFTSLEKYGVFQRNTLRQIQDGPLFTAYLGPKPSLLQNEEFKAKLWSQEFGQDPSG